jgi:hypothetical protein
MKPELSNRILIFLIIFFGLFVASGLLKYVGVVHEGMVGGDSSTPVSASSQQPIATVYEF